MAVRHYQISTGTIGALVCVTLLAIPISRLFQSITLTPFFIFIGGLSSLVILPCVVYCLSTEKNIEVTRMAMFFSPFLFASAIDVIVSMEHDGFISGFMAFYLTEGEPYLGTAYSTAICYWDGILHYLFYWIMLYSFSKGNVCFRAVSLYWFGTFFTSMIVLLLGSYSGPFTVYYPILLNVVYVVLPLLYLTWILRTTKHHKPEVAEHPGGTLGGFVKVLFTLLFMIFMAISLLRGLGALGANREFINFYIGSIEKPVTHPYQYPKVTMMLYLFYGVPFFLYSIYGLLANVKTPLTIDLSMLFAGLCSNAQVGYAGVFLTGKPDPIEFERPFYKLIFWTTNLLLLIVPQLYALYCYNCYPTFTARQSKKHS